VQLLVWIFVMRIVMLVASAAAYFINGLIAKARYSNVDEMNYEAPLTSLVWITSAVSIAFTYVVSSLIIRRWAAILRNGGNSPLSFLVAPWLAPSFRNSSKSSPRRNRVMSKKSFAPRKKAVLR